MINLDNNENYVNEYKDMGKFGSDDRGKYLKTSHQSHINRYLIAHKYVTIHV